MATTANTAKKLVDCACSAFEFGDADPETEIDNTYTTGCNAKTHSIFAQGHDAKLVGFLVRAELNGDEISYTSGGLRISPAGAVLAAGKISDALAAKAQAQLDAAHARLAKKAAAKAAATARKSAMSVVGVARTTLRRNPSSMSRGSCSSAAPRNCSPGKNSTTNSGACAN